MKSADWVLAQPWAITEESLSVILSIAERTNESPEAVAARLGRPLDNTRETTVRDGVAIIPVVGPISRYADFFSEISGATAIDTLAKDFRTAMDDPSIGAVILNIDSPGGTVSGVSEFAGHVRDARGRGKRIVAYASQAQSAGYWIASAADSVVVDATALVGSIGVIMGFRKPADDKPGAARTVQFVSSQSPHKRPDPETEAGRAQIQATADDLADVFIDAVASNRGVPRARVLSGFGQGRSLVGAKAVAAGMADRVGSLEGLVSDLGRGGTRARPSGAAAPSPPPIDWARIDREKAEAAARAARENHARAAEKERAAREERRRVNQRCLGDHVKPR